MREKLFFVMLLPLILLAVLTQALFWALGLL